MQLPSNQDFRVPILTDLRNGLDSTTAPEQPPKEVPLHRYQSLKGIFHQGRCWHLRHKCSRDKIVAIVALTLFAASVMSVVVITSYYKNLCLDPGSNSDSDQECHPNAAYISIAGLVGAIVIPIAGCIYAKCRNIPFPGFRA